jgi:hypothetical protein
LNCLSLNPSLRREGLKSCFFYTPFSFGRKGMGEEAIKCDGIYLTPYK